MAEKKRLFLAVNLGLGPTRKLGDVIARMRPTAERRGVRIGWVPPANLHVTLKFLGWAPAAVVEAIRDRVALAAAGVPAFELQVRGVGAFPSPASPRILWAGLLEPAGVLAPLAARLDAQMAELGFARDHGPFHAHVTLGRVKEGKGAEELLAPFRQAELGTTLVREVVLYESFTKSSGSEYVAQFRHALAVPERQTREVEGDKESEEPDGGQHPA